MLLTTPRMVGRPLSPADFADVRLVHGDPRAAATLSATGDPLPEQRSRDFLAGAGRHWRDHGYGPWSFRQGGTFVGYCGLRRVTIEGAAEVELLYGVVPDRWRRGLAAEMAAAACEAAFLCFGLEQLVGFTLPTNAASRRVMEKCGFVYERHFVHAGMTHILFRLTSTHTSG